MEQFSHISKANFPILFLSEKIKRKNGGFSKNGSRHWRCSIKKVFLKISQNLQKNTCVKVSFLINFYKNFLRQGNQVYDDYTKSACLHNLGMNRASLDRELLHRVSWTSTAPNQCITVRPSLSVRPFVHLLRFFYILWKNLVVLFLHRTDLFYYLKLCCTIDKAICFYQVSEISLLIAWILNWWCKLYFWLV